MATAEGGAMLRAHAHVVKFYDDDLELVDVVVPFLREGLEHGRMAVTIAVADHLRLFEAGLAAAGVDVVTARASGAYVPLDAAATLAAFMVDGMPHPARFRDVIGGILAVPASHAGVHAFGEMVALLWEAGQPAAAVALEALWNDLLEGRDVALCCAYRSSSLTVDTNLLHLHDVCEQHGVVVPPASYGDGTAGTGDFADGEVSRLFVPAPPTARAVRRFLAAGCLAWGIEDVADDAAVVASELATNAVLHASSPFRVTLSCAEGALTIAVHDTSATEPAVGPAEHDELHGRGVTLVDALSTRWGVEGRADGKVVWAELRSDDLAAPLADVG
jgi:hypothetical protein